MEYKLFDTPHSHDEAFYRNRDAADHIHQRDHKPRLLAVLDELKQIVTDEDTIADFGCGNGGLIREIEKLMDNRIWGYDLSPKNVQDAENKESHNVKLVDFVNDPTIEYPDIAICSETIEHLVNPDMFLLKLKEKGVKKAIFSTPGYETIDFHAPFHLWVWTDDSFKEVFERTGWTVDKFYLHESPDYGHRGFQIAVISRGKDNV